MQLFKVLLRDALLPALSALGFFLLNKWAYHLKAERHFAGFIVSGVVLAYVGQRYVKSFQRLLPERHSIIYQRNAHFFTLLLTAIALLSCFLFIKLPTFFQKGVLPMVVVSILYVWTPFKGWKPLRQTVMKSIIVAATWSYATVLLPGLARGLPAEGLLLITLARTAFVLGLVLPFDKYQAEFDASKGIRTLPLLLKPRWLFLFYISLWLIFYFIPEALWQVFFNNKSFICFITQNIWLFLPVVLWTQLKEDTLWLYDLLPIAALGCNVIVELVAPSLCA